MDVSREEVNFMAKMVTRLSEDGEVTQNISSWKLKADIPDDVLFKMLNVQMDIVEPEIRKNAANDLNEMGYSKGHTARSIKRHKPKKGNGNTYSVLGFDGERPDKPKNGKPRPASEVAFLNEYGGKGMAPRLFIQKAIDAKAEEAFDASEKIYDEWLKKS